MVQVPFLILILSLVKILVLVQALMTWAWKEHQYLLAQHKLYNKLQHSDTLTQSSTAHLNPWHLKKVIFLPSPLPA